jgi:hypothetical protein
MLGKSYLSINVIKNMNYKLSFQEMERLGMEKLAKQLPATLEEKRKQFQRLKKQSSRKSKKQRS